MDNVGLVPMSAKPFHRGHADLIRVAASENDTVLVFVGLGSRGIKKRKKQKRKFEEPLTGEFPIYGDTMKKLWTGHDDNEGLASIMKAGQGYQNVTFLLPGDELKGGRAAPGPLQSVLTIFASLITELANKGTLDNVTIPFLGDVTEPNISVYSDPADSQARYNENSLAAAVRSSILGAGVRAMRSMPEDEIARINQKALGMVNSVLNKSPGFNVRAVTRGEGTTDISGTRVRELLQKLRVAPDMAEAEYDDVLEELVSYLPMLPDGKAMSIVKFLVDVAVERDKSKGVFTDTLNEFNKGAIRNFLYEAKGGSSDDLILGTEDYNEHVDRIMSDIRKVKRSLNSRKKSGNYYRKEASKLQDALNALKYLSKKSQRLLQQNSIVSESNDIDRSDIKNFIHNMKIFRR